MLDRQDSRILAALRFVDAVIGAPIEATLDVRAGDGSRILRNRNNLYVLASAPGLETYTATFRLPEPPAAPMPVGTVSVPLTIRDPAGRFLPRQASVAVPRDPAIANATRPTSLFQPAVVEMFPSPTAVIAAGWATLRISVKPTGGANGDPGLPFAYLRVRRASDGVLLARGVADERGEALVAIAGIPVTTWSTSSGSSVTSSTVHVKIAAHFDRTAFDPTTGKVPDPTALERSFSSLPSSADIELDLASGREVSRRIDVTTNP